MPGRIAVVTPAAFSRLCPTCFLYIIYWQSQSKQMVGVTCRHPSSSLHLHRHHPPLVANHHTSIISHKSSIFTHPSYIVDRRHHRHRLPLSLVVILICVASSSSVINRQSPNINYESSIIIGAYIHHSSIVYRLSSSTSSLSSYSSSSLIHHQHHSKPFVSSQLGLVGSSHYNGKLPLLVVNSEPPRRYPEPRSRLIPSLLVDNPEPPRG